MQTIIEGYQLSPRQKQLWASGRDAAQCCVEIEGHLNVESLREALGRVVAAHEILRTTFQSLPELVFPLQVIADAGEQPAFDFRLADIENDARQEERLEEERAAERSRPFDYERGPLLRACLLRLSATRHRLILSLPSLVADSRSLSNILSELARLASGADGDAEGDGTLQYADFSEWHNQLLESEGDTQARSFWQSQRTPTDATFPLAAPADAHPSAYLPGLLSARVEPEVTGSLLSAAESRGVTAEEFLLSCWVGLLSRHCAPSPAPAVAVLCEGRDHAELAEAVGPYARPLPLSVAALAGASFGELLERTAEALRETRRFKEHFVPEPTGGRDGNPVVDVSFAYEQRAPEFISGGLRWTVRGAEAFGEPTTLGLRCSATDGGLELEWHYDASRLTRAGVAAVSEQFMTLLRSAVESPASPLDELDCVGEGQRHRLTREWNSTSQQFADAGLCVHDLVARQAAATPEAVAVVSGDERLSYRELDERANRLARYLRRRGVRVETPVAVMLERSTSLVVALLGVMKAGGAYVPLDPAYPQERLRWMLEDTGSPLVLTQASLADNVPASGAEVLRLDEQWGEIERESADPPDWEVSNEQLAYVIYTSGSTGRPKGVMIAHRQILNRLLWMQRRFPLTTEDAVLQKTPFSFDASVWEFFAPLMAGARLVMARPGGHREPAYLLAEAARQRVTVLQVVPSLLRALAEEEGLGRCASLRRVFSGGEALGRDVARRFCERAPHSGLVNLYGPTEASIDATYREVSEGGGAAVVSGGVGAVVEIGRPLGNVRVYVLDGGMRAAGVGVAGELYIGGAGVARGYLGRPGLTAERFVPDPFSGKVGARLYRTGDLTRWLPGGEVEYLGRIDHQVKVRGFRIELGEVEAALRTHARVREAAVVAREDGGGDKRLVAYLVTAGGGAELSPSELRRHLAESLPEYMIPSSFVALDALPLTPNGKLDRGALPDGAPAAQAAPGGASLTPAQELIAAAWSELLRVERPGLDHDFFAAGGHSLLATQLISRIQALFGVRLPVRALFESPTIAGLAARVEAELRLQHGLSSPPIARRHEGGGARAQLSFAQQRLWFLDQLEPGGSAYNVPMAVSMRGGLKVEALRRALSEVVRRHEVLRTRFEAEGGRPVQVIDEPRTVTVEVEDVSAGGEAAAGLVALEEATRPFDLERGPLYRVRLLKVGEEEHVLVVVLHHIVSDGWSTGVLVRELAALYGWYSVAGGDGSEAVAVLAEPEVQYADYAEWQREWLSGEELERQLGYWRGQLAGAPGSPDLTGGKARPAVAGHAGATLREELSGEEWGALKGLSVRSGVTPFMLMLGAFDLLLWRQTGQHDVVVGTDVANRNRTEIEGLIGFFANQLVLRVDVSGDPTFEGLLERVREVCLGAYAHQDLPFEKLVEALQTGRDLSKNSLFQVMFVFQNVPMPTLELPGLSLSLFPIGGSGSAKFDLTLFITETQSGAAITWVYNTDLFDEATIARMAGRFRHLLAGIGARPDARLSQLDFIPEAEKALAEAEEQKRKEAKRSRFVKSTPKAIDLGAVSVVRMEPLGAHSLPLVLSPWLEQVDLADWVAGNRAELDRLLLRHGALLFRGFSVRTAAQFERLASALCTSLYADYGDLPRTSLGPNVYGATPYPAEQPILFHNESSQMHTWPRKIFFCCVKAPARGGQTPVVDCRRVYRRLNAGLRERFERLGVMYVRNFTEGLDVGWREFFRTEEEREVEQYCRRAGMEWEWRAGGGLRTRKVCPAVIRHPETGEAAFFNQIQAHHVSCLASGVRESVLSLFGEEGAPRNVYYGDGRRIEDEEMAEVRGVYEEEAVDFGWEEGDVMVVENMLAAHGRRAYEGERSVMVTMGDMFSYRD